MLAAIDNLLNKITMYRLVLYYLLALILIAAIFGGLHFLPYNPIDVIVSMFLFIGTCWVANEIFAKIFRVPANTESVYITAFILTLIIPPLTLQPFIATTFWNGLGFMLLASLFAMASKYLLAIHRKHIFNPAAIAVVITALAFGQYASWWVGGNLPLMAFIIIGGLLVARKIQRFDLILSFLVAAPAGIILGNLEFNPLATLEKVAVHTCLFFFAFVMLTEPLTTPPTRPLRIMYGIIVGLLFAPGWAIGPFYSAPELALVIGNIFSYLVSPKRKYALSLKSKTEVGRDIYNFAFSTGNAGALTFNPGQYMEFTLAPGRDDLRGNRRYFTIASSPTESELQLGVKFYLPSSTFKQKMLALEPGDRMIGGQLAGDFTLPRGFAQNPGSKKLAFIAGGIGITPFRSMIKYLSDRAHDEEDIKRGNRQAQPDIVLLYSNRLISEIAYADVFDEAAKTIGLKTIYAITDAKEAAADRNFYNGRIDAKLIKREIPDYAERLFYVSGTRAMIVTFEKLLHELGVPRTHIKTDFFPGFA